MTASTNDVSTTTLMPTLLMPNDANLSEENLPMEKIVKKKEEEILTNFLDEFNQKRIRNPFGIDRIIHGMKQT